MISREHHLSLTRAGNRDDVYPDRRGFVYRVAVIDGFSRKVLIWRVSNSLTAEFCVEAFEKALARYGAPEIFSAVQSSHAGFISALKQYRIRMEGRGGSLDRGAHISQPRKLSKFGGQLSSFLVYNRLELVSCKRQPAAKWCL
jgi:transposase InsO family protein